MLDKKKHVLEAKNTYFLGLTVLGNNWVFFLVSRHVLRVLEKNIVLSPCFRYFFIHFFALNPSPT
jgi:hypothetical protein